MATETIVLLVTCPNRAEGERLAEGLVENNLAACVNLIEGLTSIYRWKGQIQKEQEVLLVLKSTGERFDAVTEYVKAYHSYTVPEIIALPVVRGHQPYLDWVGECCR